MMRNFSALGGELFVMDDGWFGKRNDDNSSLGDWFVNDDKLGGTLGHLIERVNARGLNLVFGSSLRWSMKTVICIGSIRTGHLRFREENQ